MSEKHIFIIDDEKNIRDILQKYIISAGYRVTLFESGQTVLEELRRLRPDMLVLDIMMPGEDGLELCKKVRKEADVPIIFVSARDEEFDKVLGLELGADDYLTKPFSPRELLARMKNIFKRLEKSQPVISESIRIKDVVVDRAARTISLCHGVAIPFTLREYELLEYLTCHPNRPFNREQLVTNLWGYDYGGEDRIIDDLVKRIRKKLKDHGSELEITTVWGFGYKIEN